MISNKRTAPVSLAKQVITQSPMPPPWSAETAPTQPESQSESQKSTQPEGSQKKETVDPFLNLWGRLIPCQSSKDAIDLPNHLPVFTIGRMDNNSYKLDGPKISKSSQPAYGKLK